GGPAAGRPLVRAPRWGAVGMRPFDGTPGGPLVLDRMNNRRAHRGPDGAGYLFAWPEQGGFADVLVRDVAQWEGGEHRDDVRVGLGHRRLAILDLSERGIQPMRADGVSIVFNGEIYNHHEVRSELERAGCS